MIASRRMNAAANRATITTALPIQASSSGSRLGGLGAGTGTSEVGGGGGGAGSGMGSGTASTMGSGSGTGAHLLPQRAHLTARPGARDPGTSYSAEQVGQVIRTAQSCGPEPSLATNQAHLS